MLSWQERVFYRSLIIQAILEKEGVVFEDWFVRLGSLLWGADFEPVRAQGRKGDLKCDGRRKSDCTIFQCYAPRRSDSTKVAGKIREDFEGAREIWKKGMKRWEIVINDREGLDVDATQEVEKLRSDYPQYEIDVLGPTGLEKLSLALSADDLSHLCGAALIDTAHAHWRLSYSDIGAVVDHLAAVVASGIASSSLFPPPADKIEQNALDQEVATLLTVGNLLTVQVEEFFARQDQVELESRIAGRLALAYAEMKSLGMDPTHIFYLLVEVTGGLARPDGERRAVMGVITYFFNKCDIFERAA